MNLSITPFSHSKKYRDTLKILYKKMIEFRKANPYDGAYGEIHHIVPKHLCKKLKIKQESAANKVRLSVKEHQYVHMLLERAHGLKIAHRTSIKDIADSKIATYKRFGFEKVGKIILTAEQKHVVNVDRKTKLRAYRKKINEFMSIHGSSQLIANAICDALRKKFEIPEEFQMNIGRKLTAHIRSDIPTFLNIGLQRDAV